MAIRIASWNTEGRLTAYQKRGERGTPERIVEKIAKLDADVVVLPEAYLNEPEDSANQLLQALGYTWHDAEYHDTGHDEDVRRWGRPHLRVLYRIPARDFTVQRWGGMRDLLTFTVTDQKAKKEVCICAIHLDDLSEARRMKQIDAIIPFVRDNPLPVVMLGDFNAMWHEGRAKLLASRVVHFIVRHLLGGELLHVLLRLSEMAEGTVMQKLRDEAHMTDADSSHRPTTTPKMRGMPLMPSIRLVQIDHILISKSIHADQVRVGADGGSDHRSLLTTIDIDK
jgi:endonuclease/exonuclease/phosphatase family metal-dependent hydrolase